MTDNEHNIEENENDLHEGAEGDAASDNNDEAAPKEKKERKAVAKKEKSAAGDSSDADYKTRRGRESNYVGKTIYHTIEPSEDGSIKNPRKVGSFGEKSLQIIIDAGEEGIGYVEFIAAGGRLKDLVWDIQHNHAKAE